MSREIPARQGDPADVNSTESGNSNQGATATCSVCGGTGLVETRISTAFRSGDDWAVIKHIPAIVCVACQEEFVDDATAVQLDMMRANGFSGQAPSETMTVPVYAFPSDDETRS